MSTQSTATVQPDLRTGIVRRLVQVIMGFTIQGILLFASAWTLRYWEGWVYIGLYVATVIVNASFLMRTNPEIIAERGRGTAAGNWKDWDKIVGLTYGVLYFFAVLIVATAFMMLISFIVGIGFVLIITYLTSVLFQLSLLSEA